MVGWQLDIYRLVQYRDTIRGNVGPAHSVIAGDQPYRAVLMTTYLLQYANSSLQRQRLSSRFSLGSRPHGLIAACCSSVFFYQTLPLDNGAFVSASLTIQLPMGSFGNFLVVYILGGLTFVPLVLSLVFFFVYLTLPSLSPPTQEPCDRPRGTVRRPTDDQYSLKSGTDELAEKFHRTHETDVAAGYFAVCREYVPGGVNGKPPERTTPAGEVIAAESPSVYQTMYRSLFDRKQTPTIDPTKMNGKNGKRARNVFYIVLR